MNHKLTVNFEMEVERDGQTVYLDVEATYGERINCPGSLDHGGVPVDVEACNAETFERVDLSPLELARAESMAINLLP